MKSKKRQKHVENKEKRKMRAAKVKKLARANAKLAKEAREKTNLNAIASNIDTAVQISQVITSSDVDSKDPPPATQPSSSLSNVTTSSKDGSNTKTQPGHSRR